MRPLDSMRPPDYIALGRVSGLFGVKGWVKVFSDTQPRENIIQYGTWWLNNAKNTEDWQEGDWQEHKVLQAQPHGKTIIASFDGITTREAAAKLVGQLVAIPRDLLPEAQKDEYYWADLVGCKVVSVSGHEMGLVDRLFETGANDVLVVTRSEGGNDSAGKIGISSEVLIPWVVPDVITSIDTTAKQIVVDWDPDY